MAVGVVGHWERGWIVIMFCFEERKLLERRRKAPLNAYRSLRTLFSQTLKRASTRNHPCPRAPLSSPIQEALIALRRSSNASSAAIRSTSSSIPYSLHNRPSSFSPGCTVQ